MSLIRNFLDWLFNGRCFACCEHRGRCFFHYDHIGTHLTYCCRWGDEVG